VGGPEHKPGGETGDGQPGNAKKAEFLAFLGLFLLSSQLKFASAGF
jgi:hypothetical protein